MTDQAAPTYAELVEYLETALDHYERNICHHDTTHRGGALWTICDDCGSRWADDRGGFKPFQYHPAILAALSGAARAKAMLSSLPPDSPEAAEGPPYSATPKELAEQAAARAGGVFVRWMTEAELRRAWGMHAFYYKFRELAIQLGIARPDPTPLEIARAEYPDADPAMIERIVQIAQGEVR